MMNSHINHVIHVIADLICLCNVLCNTMFSYMVPNLVLKIKINAKSIREINVFKFYYLTSKK